MNSEIPGRTMPRVSEVNAYFWMGGKDGRLHILRCESCGYWIHPYAARCPECRAPNLSPQAVSGRGTVVGFTVNHQPWFEDVPVPYVVAVVALDEQDNVRLMTNLLRTPIDDVHVGMPVSVYFEQHGGIFLPQFEAAPEVRK